MFQNDEGAAPTEETTPQKNLLNNTEKDLVNQAIKVIQENLTPENTTLFQKTFKGLDIVPSYWKRGDKAGYSPLCGNKFDAELCNLKKKIRGGCGICKNADYTHLSDDLVKHHINGGGILGVYPLKQDNTCHFIAADFDRHNPTDPDPRNDVQAYIDTCQVNEIPCYVLRSKSGNGYHVYIFFQDAVPAWKARKVAFELLREGGVVGDGVELSTFDRLFPNQNKHSGKGLGNLIALPFQGAAGLHGNTLFLDPENDYQPYPDQWAALRDAETVTEAYLDSLINEWGLEQDKAPVKEWDGNINGSADTPRMNVNGILHGVPEGNRDESIFKMACRLREKGLSLEEAQIIIFNMADGCSPPFPRGEAVKKIESAWKYEPGVDVAERSLNDTLQWIEDTDDKRDILDGWLDRITGLSAPDIDAVKNAVHKKTGTKKGVLNTVLKEKKARDKKADAKARAEEKSKKRAENNIQEIMYHSTATGVCCHECSKALGTHPEGKIYRFAGDIIKIVDRQPSTVRMVQQIHERGGEYPPITMIGQFTKETLCHELEKVAVCQITDIEGEVKDISWPKNILAGIMALTEFHEKPLVGIVGHPFIDDNFKPVLTQGYDAATGLYIAHDVVPEIDSFSDADEALFYIVEEVLRDFPFSTPLDEMAAVSCLLTGMQRKLISGGCPGFGFTAPIQASGKTALAQTINYSLYGRPVAATSYSDDDAEMAKHILGILQEGHSAILFDNIAEGSVVESNELAKVITSDSYSNRLLSKNKTLTVPCSVLWLMTGNNVSVCGDFNTRFIMIELDPKDANPDQRRFKREDIGVWCEQHRGKILGACMRIIMNGAGYSNPDLKPTRFPSWDKFVRLPVHKISGIDIAEIFQKNKLADPKIEGQNNFFEAWFNAFGSAPTTTKQVLNQCLKVSDHEKFSGISEDNELADAIKDIFSGPALPSSQSLGKWLKRMKNRFFGDYKLVHAGTGTNREQINKALWVVQRAKE